MRYIPRWKPLRIISRDVGHVLIRVSYRLGGEWSEAAPPPTSFPTASSKPSILFSAIGQSKNLQDGPRTQVRRAEVLCSKCSHDSYLGAVPRLCLSILPKDVQHSLYFCLPIDQTEVCFEGSNSLQTTDPAVASLLHFGA
jgi:hypothetical protein